VGPAGQPQKYAVAISDPNLGNASGTLPGLITFVDFSGDTILITAGIGVKPYYLVLNSSGGTAYTLNGDGTVNIVPISTSLIASSISQTTLLDNPAPNAASVFPQGTYTYITQPGRASVAELTGGSALTLQQELAPVGPTPIYIAGVASAPRVYVLSPSATAGANGTATPIEVATNTPSGALPVGVNPVYGVMTADARRAFIMNNGSNTVSVINAQNNALDAGVPNGTIQDPNAIAPIWADFAPTLNEILVANAGDGVSNGGDGSVSIFSIPLCSVVAQPTNPNCNVDNPIDAAGFGSLVAHVSVGKNPIMVAALQDGSQAYVINQGDSTVSVINLITNTVTATIPVPATPNPTFVAVTTGTPTGKVYVTSKTSSTMTVIRTDTNQVDTTVPLQGYGMQVRVTAP
jgi:YVTN family beta-propeller protein